MLQEKKSDKNTLIAMLLMGALLMGYLYINKPTEEQLKEKQEQLVAQKQEDNKLVETQNNSVEEASDSTVIAAKSEDYQYESEKFLVLFSGKGGGISELQLKDYTAFSENSEDHKKPLYLIKQGNNVFDLIFKDKEGKTIHSADLAFAPSVKEIGGKTIVTMTSPLKSGKLEYVYTIGEDYTIGFEIKSEEIDR